MPTLARCLLDPLQPDIAHASSKLSEFLTNPSPHHLECANRTLGYLYNLAVTGARIRGRVPPNPVAAVAGMFYKNTEV